MTTSSNPAAWELVQQAIERELSTANDASGSVPIPTIKASVPESERAAALEEIHYAIGEGRLELLGDWPSGSVRLLDPEQ